MSTDKTYVYNGTEVIMTGRTASKKIRGRGEGRLITLHEIKPSNEDDGSWKKWVKESELYEVDS